MWLFWLIGPNDLRGLRQFALRSSQTIKDLSYDLLVTNYSEQRKSKVYGVYFGF